MDLHLPFVDVIATIGPIAAISNDNVLAISNKMFVSKNSLFGERQGDVISDPIKCRQELCTAGVNKDALHSRFNQMTRAMSRPGIT
jgi:hypothetical protein